MYNLAIKLNIKSQIFFFDISVWVFHEVRYKTNLKNESSHKRLVAPTSLNFSMAKVTSIYARINVNKANPNNS